MDLLQWFIFIFLFLFLFFFFDKKSSGSDAKSEIITNEELAEELHKPIIRKFKKQEV